MRKKNKYKVQTGGARMKLRASFVMRDRRLRRKKERERVECGSGEYDVATTS